MSYCVKACLLKEEHTQIVKIPTANAFISFLPAERQVRLTICVSQLILKYLCLLASTYIYWRRSIISVKIFRNLYKSRGRWIRPLLLLIKRTHPPRSGQILESSSAIESLEVEFAPELQISRLDSYSSRLVDDSGQGRSLVEDPSKVVLTSPKQYSHSSNDPQPALVGPKHSDKPTQVEGQIRTAIFRGRSVP